MAALERQRCMRLDEPSARTIFLFSLRWRSTAGLFRPPVVARRLRSYWQSGKTSPEGLLAVRRFVISPKVWLLISLK